MELRAKDDEKLLRFLNAAVLLPRNDAEGRIDVIGGHMAVLD